MRAVTAEVYKRLGWNGRCRAPATTRPSTGSWSRLQGTPPTSVDDGQRVWTSVSVEHWLPLLEPVRGRPCGGQAPKLHGEERSFPVRRATTATSGWKRPADWRADNTAASLPGGTTQWIRERSTPARALFSWSSGAGGPTPTWTMTAWTRAAVYPQAQVFTQPNRPVETSTPGSVDVCGGRRPWGGHPVSKALTRGRGMGSGCSTWIRGSTSGRCYVHHGHLLPDAPGADRTNPNTGAAGERRTRTTRSSNSSPS